MARKLLDRNSIGPELLNEASYSLDVANIGDTRKYKREGLNDGDLEGAIKSFDDNTTEGDPGHMTSKQIGYSKVIRITTDISDISNPISRSLNTEMVTEDILEHTKYRNIPPELKDTIRVLSKTVPNNDTVDISTWLDTLDDTEKDLYWRLRMQQDTITVPVVVFSDTHVEEVLSLSTTEGSSRSPTTNQVGGLSVTGFLSFSPGYVDHIRETIKHGIDYWYDRPDNAENVLQGYWIRKTERFYKTSGYTRFVTPPGTGGE